MDEQAESTQSYDDVFRLLRYPLPPFGERIEGPLFLSFHENDLEPMTEIRNGDWLADIESKAGQARRGLRGEKMVSLEVAVRTLYHLQGRDTRASKSELYDAFMALRERLLLFAIHFRVKGDMKRYIALWPLALLGEKIDLADGRPPNPGNLCEWNANDNDEWISTTISYSGQMTQLNLKWKDLEQGSILVRGSGEMGLLHERILERLGLSLNLSSHENHFGSRGN